MDNYFVFVVGCVSGWLERSKMVVHFKIPRTLLWRPQGTAFRRTLTIAKYLSDMTEYGRYWPFSSAISCPFMEASYLNYQAAEDKRLDSKSSSLKASRLTCWGVSDAEFVPSALCSQVHPET